ncbi:MAG: tetratricopeptide repeat protein [Spirochaetales bacterium]|nr:tetratricopeptide repeat protein [Spirochaetales bacterium]
MKNTGIPIIFLFSFFLLQGTLFASEDLTREQILDLLYQGNSLFREATEYSKKDPWKAKDNYVKAAMHFERIVREGGIRNGKLFYNIGNAYFKAGDLGKAILNYKRALKLIPNDVNLKKNLDYARSRRIDKIEEKEQTRIFRILFFWHYETSPEMRFAVFIIFFFIIWIFAGFMLFFKKSLLKWGVILPAIIAGLFFGSLFIDVITASGNNPGVILAREVIARKGDSDAYERSFQDPLHAGTEFTLVEKRRGWYNIELINGTNCWIPEKDAELVKIE